MMVESAVFMPGMSSLPHHHSGVEAVYVLEGEACFETPARAAKLQKGEPLLCPATRQCERWSPDQRVVMLWPSSFMTRRNLPPCGWKRALVPSSPRASNAAEAQAQGISLSPLPAMMSTRKIPAGSTVESRAVECWRPMATGRGRSEQKGKGTPGGTMCDIPTDLSRRRFVRLSSLATGALTLSGVSTLFAKEQDFVRRETADLITRPFYPRVKPHDKDADLTIVRGTSAAALAASSMQLSGRVTNLKGSRSRNVPIQIWQANTHGRYAQPI